MHSLRLHRGLTNCNLKPCDHCRYMGLKQPRLRGDAYYEIVDEFVQARGLGGGVGSGVILRLAPAPRCDQQGVLVHAAPPSCDAQGTFTCAQHGSLLRQLPHSPPLCMFTLVCRR